MSIAGTGCEPAGGDDIEDVEVGGEGEVEDVEVELLVSSTFFFFRVFCDVWRASKEFAVTKSPNMP